VRLSVPASFENQRTILRWPPLFHFAHRPNFICQVSDVVKFS
jgi:hypothetical protein